MESAKRIVRRCYVCGSGFISKNPKQITCGEEECKRENGRIRMQEWRRNNTSYMTVYMRKYRLRKVYERHRAKVA